MKITSAVKSAFAVSLRKRALHLATLSLLTGPGATYAEGTLTLEQALKNTLQHHPQLQAFPYELRQRDGLKAQAALRPIPELDVSLDNILGSGDFEGTDRAELTLGFSQAFERGNKREKRLAVSEGLTEQSKIEFALTSQEVLAETKRRYYQLQYQQALQLQLSEQKSLEQRALKVIRSRAQAGAVGQADVSKMSLQLANTQAQQEQLKGGMELSKLRLAAMWMEEANFSRVDADAQQMNSIPSRDIVLSALNNSPAYQQRFVLEQLSQDRVELEKAKGITDVRFGLGVRQFESSNDQALLFSFNMPLALQNPNQGNIAVANASADLALAESKRVKQQLKLTALNKLQHLNNLQQQDKTYRKQLIPLAKKLLRNMEKGYQLGTYNVLQWVDAQSELFQLNQALIDNRYEYLTQKLELERLIGKNLESLMAGES